VVGSADLTPAGKVSQALGLASARLGVSLALGVVISAQLVAGLVLDRVLGQVVIGGRHVVGIVLVVAGLVLIAGRT
jgi:uncharacterized membrane protein YdcZ (DUF606 family)